MGWEAASLAFESSLITRNGRNTIPEVRGKEGSNSHVFVGMKNEEQLAEVILKFIIQYGITTHLRLHAGIFSINQK